MKPSFVEETWTLRLINAHNVDSNYSSQYLIHQDQVAMFADMIVVTDQMTRSLRQTMEALIQQMLTNMGDEGSHCDERFIQRLFRNTNIRLQLQIQNDVIEFGDFTQNGILSAYGDILKLRKQRGD